MTNNMEGHTYKERLHWLKLQSLEQEEKAGPHQGFKDV